MLMRACLFAKTDDACLSLADSDSHRNKSSNKTHEFFSGKGGEAGWNVAADVSG